MTRILRFVFPGMSIGLLATGYFFRGQGWSASGLLVVGIGWIIGLALRWEWVSTLALFLASGAAALGLLLGLSPVIMNSSALFALLAWDLAGFYIRLSMASPEDDIPGLEKRHLSRLFSFAAIGGAMCVFALTVHFKPSFEWMVILVFFIVWGMGRMVDWLLKYESRGRR